MHKVGCSITELEIVGQKWPDIWPLIRKLTGRWPVLPGHRM